MGKCMHGLMSGSWQQEQTHRSCWLCSNSTTLRAFQGSVTVGIKHRWCSDFCLGGGET